MSKYANAVYGNLAYGLDHTVEKRQPVRTREHSVKKRPVSVRAGAKTVANQYISPFAVIGSACVAILFVLVILSYINLAQISNDSVKMYELLDSLSLEETRLQLKYEGIFDLNEVERFATSELGMVKPSGTQKEYISNEASDQAMILGNENTDTGLFATISAFFSRIVSLFE